VLQRGLRHDQIEKAVLAGFDWGARTANIVAALWPERRMAMVSANGYPINTLERDKPPMPPKIERGSRRTTASPIAWNKMQKP
jgi:hypothetical protein